MAGVAQRNKLPVLASLFLDPQKQVFSNRRGKNVYAAEYALEVDCRSLGLEANQGHIKLFHFTGIKEKAPECIYSAVASFFYVYFSGGFSAGGGLSGWGSGCG